MRLNKSSLWILIVLGVIAFPGCAQKQPNRSFREMTDPECQFNRVKLEDSPQKLIDEYLRREAGGEFTLTSRWFDSATLCPGHEDGPELSYVSRSSRVLKLVIGDRDGRAFARVQYDVAGLIEPGPHETWHFVARRRKKVRTFKLVHTAYGWRIRDSHLVDGEYLSIATAKSRVASKIDQRALARLKR